MAKQTDIAGTFRVPEEAWGRFWNLMLTIPGAEITPSTRVEASPKRTQGKTTEGSTGKCIVLRALSGVPQLARFEIEDVLVKAGKSATSAASMLTELKKSKLAKLGSKGYFITAAGRKYLKASCPHAK